MNILEATSQLCKIVILFMIIAFGIVWGQQIKPSNAVIQKYAKYYEYSCAHNICNVYLTDTIEDDSNYLGLYKLIVESPKNTVINIHLSGYGGDVSTVVHLANAIQESKAEVDTIVEGNVFSAHAFIAMLGKHIYIQPNVLLLFHIPAVQDPKTGENITMNQLCLYYKGYKDRGQDAYLKCLEDSAAYNNMFNTLVSKYVFPYLTSNEIIRFNDGWNINVQGSDMSNRLKSKDN